LQLEELNAISSSDADAVIIAAGAGSMRILPKALEHLLPIKLVGVRARLHVENTSIFRFAQRARGKGRASSCSASSCSASACSASSCSASSCSRYSPGSVSPFSSSLAAASSLRQLSRVRCRPSSQPRGTPRARALAGPHGAPRCFRGPRSLPQALSHSRTQGQNVWFRRATGDGGGGGGSWARDGERAEQGEAQAHDPGHGAALLKWPVLSGKYLVPWSGVQGSAEIVGGATQEHAAPDVLLARGPRMPRALEVRINMGRGSLRGERALGWKVLRSARSEMLTKLSATWGRTLLGAHRAGGRRVRYSHP
jgi:hypothetical protein